MLTAIIMNTINLVLWLLKYIHVLGRLTSVDVTIIVILGTIG